MTGLYYFGARYYDPQVSLWQSADPILGKYLDKAKKKNLGQNRSGGAAENGVYNSMNLALYTYADTVGKPPQKKGLSRLCGQKFSHALI
jgi:RHS repeat-associated protein